MKEFHENECVKSLLTLGISVLYFGTLYLWFIIRYKKRNMDIVDFSKKVLFWVVLLGGLILYFIGYGVAHKDFFNLTNIWLSIYSTARLFILGNDMVEIKQIFEESPNPIEIHLLHLGFSLIMATVVFIFIVIFLRVLTNQKYGRKKIKKSEAEDNYLFMGINEASIALAKEILQDTERNKKSLVLFIDTFINEQEKELLEPLLKAGAISVGTESFFDKIVLKNEEFIVNAQENENSGNKKTKFDGDFFVRHKLLDCILKRKTHLFYFSKNEDWNVLQAKNILTELQQYKNNHGFVVYVRTLVQDYLESEYDKLLLNEDGIEVRYINDSLIAAKRLVKEYPPVQFVEPDTRKALATQDFTPLLIGFGRIGQSVLRKLVEMGCFVGNNFRALVIDEKMNQLFGRFDNRFPGLAKNYKIEFVHQSIGEKSLYERLIQQPEFLKYIVISLGNDELNVLLALELKRLALRLNKPYKIFVHINDKNIYNNLFEEGEDEKLIAFGRICNLFSFADVIDNSILKKAQKIHEIYTKHSDEDRKQKDWEKLDRMKQLSNISVMEHLPTKNALLGMSNEKIASFESEASFLKELGKERRENLAVCEHLRWNAHYYANGWDTLPIDEINKDSNKDYKRRLHGCLVSWEALDEVGKRSWEVKEYDRLNVVSMWEQIKKGDEIDVNGQLNSEK